MSIAASAIAISLALAAGAQEPARPPDARDAPQIPRIEERVEIVSVTPVHGIGLPTTRIPSNVQVFTAARAQSAPGGDVAALLNERAAGVQVSDAQAGTFQPDLLFRGFAASPLLGASEGLAVYQDGVRMNDPFGDTMQWDIVPSAAIASINLMPGSNPLFGLNALGGALSIRTKNGFDHPGLRASVATGSFARHRLDLETGAHGRSFGYYIAGSLLDEDGWRDFSPSAIRRVFADAAWRGSGSAVNVSLTAASNDLTGNGPAPLPLLDEDRSAVFTHPDRTDTDLAILTVNARRHAGAATLLEGVGYYRHGRTATFNGDAADDDEDETDDNAALVFDAVNHISHTRTRAAGVTGQITRAAPLGGRDNHFVAGAGLDAAGTRFDFAAELAQLTADRGTTRTGLFEDDEFVNVHTRVVTGSAFAANAWSPSSAVTLTASARFNWTALRLRDRIGTALNGDHRFRRLNPAFGATYQATSRVNVFGSYTQSSRVPTPVELTCADPEDPCRLPNAFVSDPPLKQIVAATWEGGLRGASAPWQWAIAAFTTASSDDIVFVSSGRLRGEGHFENIERTRRRGIEATLQYERDGIAAFAAYTLQHATFGADLRIASRFHPEAVDAEVEVEDGDRLPGVPVHSAKAGVTAAVGGRLTLGVNVRAQSGQFLRGDEPNLLPELPGFAAVNALARARITRRIAAVAEAHNLFDGRFYTFGALGDAEPVLPVLNEGFDDPRFYSPSAPRAVWAGLEIRF
jgi:outer membrane receptor protein involved in Fe transport